MRGGKSRCVLQRPKYPARKERKRKSPTRMIFHAPAPPASRRENYRHTKAKKKRSKRRRPLISPPPNECGGSINWISRRQIKDTISVFKNASVTFPQKYISQSRVISPEDYHQGRTALGQSVFDKSFVLRSI